MKSIKFNRYNVANATTGTKARVWYSLDNRTDGRKCVTIYAKDYSDKLAAVFGTDCYENETDIMTDYFEKGRVVLFEDNPLYAAARARAELNIIDRTRDARSMEARRAADAQSNLILARSIVRGMLDAQA
jgi:hypothetical protein